MLSLMTWTNLHYFGICTDTTDQVLYYSKSLKKAVAKYKSDLTGYLNRTGQSVIFFNILK